MNNDIDLTNQGLTDHDLTNQLRRLASSQPSEAGPDVERHLIAAFRARHRRKIPLWAYVAAALACIAFFAGSNLLRPRPVVANRVYNAPGFIALPYAESGVPMESAVVMRVQMRSAELASMGVTLPPAPPAARIKADLLVGQDGVPRAVRLVE